MSEEVFLKEIFIQIKDACERINRRVSLIKSPDDFYTSDDNLDKLDAICMLLIAIGESLKKIDKRTDGKLLVKYPAVDWKGLKGIRDVISHQYFDLNSEAVFNTCKKDIPILLNTLTLLIKHYK